MPIILRQHTRKWYEMNFSQLENTGLDGFVVGNYEALGLVTELKSKDCTVITDSSLYAWSRRSVDALLCNGAREYTYPVEANEKELRKIGKIAGEMILYGYLPLMVSAQCVQKNTIKCTKEAGILTLNDRYHKIFKVKNQCKDCYNLIYNSSPLALFHQKKGLDKINVARYRISFTFEKNEIISEVMSLYEKSFLRNEKPEMNNYFKDFTNGHWKRGVE